MTYWADNIKFIKDVLDSKYKKIEDALSDVSLGTIYCPHEDRRTIFLPTKQLQGYIS